MSAENKELNPDNLPPHLAEYFDLMEKVGAWCTRRASAGDVTVETLANKFANNVINSYGTKKH